MTDATYPTRAYDLLDQLEKQAVEDYLEYAVKEQHRKGERIIHALYLPIPHEYIRRSREALYKPLVRAALAERLREKAGEQDISPDRVIQEHACIAFSNITDYIEEAGFGDFKVKDLKQINPEKMAAVKSIETKPGMYGLSTKVVLHEKLPSLKALGEMMGLVAPDRPPALQDYIKPPTDTRTVEQAPDKEYHNLLESLQVQ